MQNPISKLRQGSIISEKPSFLSEKLKILTSSNYHTVYYFLLKFCARFLLTEVYKNSTIFLFCLNLELLIKCKKRVCRNQVVLIFVKNSRSEYNKKTQHSFEDIGK